MKTYEVIEVEKEDWENLKFISKKDALEILGGDLALLRGYLGSYEYGSSDVYHYDKARIYFAIKKLISESVEK